MYCIDGRRDLTSPPARLSGYAGARRGGSATERSTNARTTCSAPCWTISPTPDAATGCRAAMAHRQVAGPMRHGGLARTRPGHLGGSRQAAALRVLQADGLARLGPRVETPRSAATQICGELAAIADEIKADILLMAVDKRGVLRQHSTRMRLDASTLLQPSSDSCPRRRAAARQRARHRRRADRTRLRAALPHRRDDDGMSGEDTSLICSFWLVSALAIIGEEQRARDLMERLLRGRLAARALRRGVRRRHRSTPRQLSAGLFPPCAHRGRGQDHRR
jgi:hypothetical protein